MKNIIKGVNSKWAGISVDTGNFTTQDPYKDIAELVRYTVNWQVKEFMDGYGGTTKTDYIKTSPNHKRWWIQRTYS